VDISYLTDLWGDQFLPYFVLDFKVIVFDMAFSGTVDPKHFDFDQETNSFSTYVGDILTILYELIVDKCVYVLM
jgi:hypothetical protein